MNPTITVMPKDTGMPVFRAYHHMVEVPKSLGDSLNPLFTKAFRPVSGSNGTIATWLLSRSSMSMPPMCVSVMVGARN